MDRSSRPTLGSLREAACIRVRKGPPGGAQRGGVVLSAKPEREGAPTGRR